MAGTAHPPPHGLHRQPIAPTAFWARADVLAAIACRVFAEGCRFADERNEVDAFFQGGDINAAIAEFHWRNSRSCNRARLPLRELLSLLPLLKECGSMAVNLSSPCGYCHGSAVAVVGSGSKSCYPLAAFSGS